MKLSVAFLSTLALSGAQGATRGQTCTGGLAGIEDTKKGACCPLGCGQCGGGKCKVSGYPLFSKFDCCSNRIIANDVYCESEGAVAPCIIGSAPMNPCLDPNNADFRCESYEDPSPLKGRALNLARCGMKDSDLDDLKACIQTVNDSGEGIKTLYLERNNLQTLPSALFDGLSSLQYLDLNYNDRLHTLETGVFDGLSSVLNLALNSNDLQTLETGAFDGLDSLQYLFLNNNDRLRTLEAEIFDGLSSLQHLYLNNNDLHTLPSGIFDGLSSLQNLYLEFNSLKTLPSAIFDGLSSLQYLDLMYNDLRTLPSGTFDGLSSLQKLYLNYNDLHQLPSGIFDGLSSLQYLYLNDNELQTLPAGIFEKLSLLELLCLQSNELQTLPAGIFHNLSAMRMLFLEVNPDLGCSAHPTYSNWDGMIGDECGCDLFSGTDGLPDPCAEEENKTCKPGPEGYTCGSTSDDEEDSKSTSV